MKWSNDVVASNIHMAWGFHVLDELYKHVLTNYVQKSYVKSSYFIKRNERQVSKQKR